MEKVMCKRCHSIGYTASPDVVRCSVCGGRHEIIPEERIRCVRLTHDAILYIKRLGAIQAM